MGTGKALSVYSFSLWIAAAILLRVVAMFSGVHSDVIFVNYFPSKLAYEGVVNIYQYIGLNFPGEKMWSYYPPMTYFTLGLCQVVFKPFVAGFNVWIYSMYFGDIGKWLVENGATYTFFKYLFFMKLPYVVFDGICLFCVIKSLRGEDERLRGLRLWILNPVVLYGIYMFGQVDIMPAAFAALAVFFMYRGRLWQGFLLLSLGALYKTFTIFLIPLFLVMFIRGKGRLLKNLAATIAPFIFIYLPLYVSGGKEAIYSMFPRFFQVATGDSLHFSVFIVAVFALLYLYLMFYCFKIGKRADGDLIVKVCVAALMIVYVYSMATFPATVHHFVWVMPFLIIAVCLGIMPEWLYWLQVASLFLYNLNGPLTTTALLAPLNPGVFMKLPGLPDLMHLLLIPWGAVMLFGQVLFIALCVIIATDLMGLTCFIGRFRWKGNYAYKELH
jgi:hypothetical protein